MSLESFQWWWGDDWLVQEIPVNNSSSEKWILKSLDLWLERGELLLVSSDRLEFPKWRTEVRRNVYQVVNDPIEHDQTVIFPPFLQRCPAQVLLHWWNRLLMCSIWETVWGVGYESYCPMLYSLQFVDALLMVGVPDGWGVFEFWSHVSFICLFLQGPRTVLEVLPKEAKHPVASSTYVVNVEVPLEFVGETHTQVLRVLHCCKSLTRHLIRELEFVFCLEGYRQDAAFLDIKLHTPGVGPVSEFFKVAL